MIVLFRQRLTTIGFILRSFCRFIRDRLKEKGKPFLNYVGKGHGMGADDGCQKINRTDPDND
jgi:hypothetical protein